MEMLTLQNDLQLKAQLGLKYFWCLEEVEKTELYTFTVNLKWSS